MTAASSTMRSKSESGLPDLAKTSSTRPSRARPIEMLMLRLLLVVVTVSPSLRFGRRLRDMLPRSILHALARLDIVAGAGVVSSGDVRPAAGPCGAFHLTTYF